jgi:hypothetical protein
MRRKFANEPNDAAVLLKFVISMSPIAKLRQTKTLTIFLFDCLYSVI